MNQDITLWEHYIKLLPALILALTGGFVKALQVPNELTLGRVVAGLFTAGFTGAVVYLGVADVHSLSETTKAALIGVSGYAAADILPFIQKILKKWLTRYNPGT